MNVKDLLKQSTTVMNENGLLDEAPKAVQQAGENYHQQIGCSSLEAYVLKLDQYTQTNLDDENLTLAEYLEKYCKKEEVASEVVKQVEVAVENPDDTTVVEVAPQEEKKVPDTVKVSEKVPEAPAKKAAPVTKYAAVVNSTAKPLVRPAGPAVPSKTVLPARTTVPPKIVRTAPNVRKSATLSSLTHFLSLCFS